MADYVVGLGRLVSLPGQLDTLLEPVSPILDRLALSGFSASFQAVPDMATVGTTVPPISWEEYVAELKPHEPDPSGTPDPPPPLPTVTVTPVERDYYAMTLDLQALSEIAVDLAGLEGVAVVLNPGRFGVGVVLKHELVTVTAEIRCALRFSPDLLRPMRAVKDADGKVRYEADSSKPYVQVLVGKAGLTADSAGNVSLEAEGGVTLSDPVMIGETGVILENVALTLNLDGKGQKPEGAPESWRGVFIRSASVRIPDLFDGAIKATNLGIGQGGVSGKIELSNGDVIKGKVLGVEGAITAIALTFQQNIPVQSEIRGWVRLPFFDTTAAGQDPEAQRIQVAVSLGLDGNFMVRLADPAGTATLHIKDILEVKIASLGFEVARGISTVRLSGRLKPLAGGLDWPSFDVRELVIDSEGNVHLDGGWQDLPQHCTLDFHGFKVEITKLGFGRADDGRKWIGFSGGIRLIEGLPAGASVEGLRILWDDVGRYDVTFNGVGVEFEVPGVLRFKGAVAYQAGSAREPVVRFDGAIKLELIALDIKMDAQLVFGSHQTQHYAFFAIYVGVELPAGIPLWCTGLGLYGMAGLFALNMEPGKRQDEPWYGMGKTEGWYKRDGVGVARLSKWAPRKDSLALGAGVTLGTLSDGGYTFSGKMLLVLILPGPILMIEGKANLLKERARLDEEPTFRALAVLDARAGSFLFGLDAQYKHDDKGRLIDIHGSAEALFSLNDAAAWHLYIGQKEPKDRRIRAQMLSLFKANAYFMLDANRLATGAWIGFAQQWDFRVVALALEAWIDGNAAISWKPAQFHGDLWLHGKVALRVLFFKLGLTADAYIAADVFEPFQVLAGIRVTVDLPWPLPPLKANLELKWGPQPDKPPLPLPLQEVAVEHLKVSTTWPLPRGTHLLPNYDPQGDGFRQQPAGPREPANLLEAPVVPLDCRPRLTFSRPVHDEARVGGNPLPVQPAEERIGDPARNQGPVTVRYTLQGLALHKRSGDTWKLVARQGKTGVAADDADQDVDALYGSWAPVPALPDRGGRAVAQTKLWLWSKTPFDYTRSAGSAWEEWFTRRFEGYPCPGPPPDREVCCGFGHLAGGSMSPPWRLHEDPEIVLVDAVSGDCEIASLDPPLHGKGCALRFLRGQQANIVLGQPARAARLFVASRPVARSVSFASRAPSREPLDPFRDPNPRPVEGVSFEAFHVQGGHEFKPTTTVIQELPGYPEHGSGLYCAHRLAIALPDPAEFVELALTVQSLPVILRTYDDSGSLLELVEIRDFQFVVTDRALARMVADGVPVEVVAEVEAMKGEVWPDRGLFVDVLRARIGPAQTLAYAGLIAMSAEQHLMTLRLDRSEDGIKQIYVNVQGEEYLHWIRYACVPWIEVDGTRYEPIPPDGQVIEVPSGNLQRIALRAGEGACLAGVCVTFEPDAAEAKVRQDMIDHLNSQLARWQDKDAVLEPDTIYRLAVVTRIRARGDPEGMLTGYLAQETQTEYAYFRTEGPPGLSRLSRPLLPKKLEQFDSGLDDLAAYVRQTIPATVPARGQKPSLPRPVYRAYDVGVEFDENYVDLMYRLAGRDLGLYLYDHNNRPVRDAQGRLVVLSNRWGQAEAQTLTRSQTRTIRTYNASTCALLDSDTIQRDVTLASAAEGQVLEADAVYEARLVPLLLHDDFVGLAGTVAGGTGAKLAGWTVQDVDTSHGPSTWVGKGHQAFRGKQATLVGSVLKLEFPPGQPAPSLTGLAAVGRWSGDPDRIVLKDGAGQEITTLTIYSVDDEAKTLTVNGTPDLRNVAAWSIPHHPLLQGKRIADVGTGMRLDATAGLSTLVPHLDALILAGDSARLSRRYEICSLDQEARIVNVEGRPGLAQEPSAWEIPALGAILQTSRAGTVLWRGEAGWTDYRLSALLRTRAPAMGAIGLVLRYRGPQDYYAFSMDRGGRRLVRVLHGQQTTLVRDTTGCAPDRDYLITVEAVGSSLRVYQDGELLFDHEDGTPIAAGSVGLYCEDNAGACFRDVRLDDFRKEAPVVYRFRFTTSRFAAFAHHMHSYQDETWPLDLGAHGLSEADLKKLVGSAAKAPAAPSADEHAAYETLAKQVLGTARHQRPPELRVTRLEWQKKGFAFLVQSPEPLDWKRTQLQVLRADREQMRPALPGAVKLVGVTFARTRPNEESVTLLLREAVGLAGYRIEMLRPAAGSGQEPTWETYYAFGQEARLPAGTRVRVYAGSLRDAPPEEAGVVQRFAAPPEEGGQQRLTPAGGATLRVVAPDGSAGHTRHFWPMARYATDLTDDVRLLRNADGTGLVLLAARGNAPTGSLLAEGSYRLRFTYQRSVEQGDLPVLSQAGVTAAERVTLDLPWATLLDDD
jgi:hypothetical protein